jgi:hypothetical protein
MATRVAATLAKYGAAAALERRVRGEYDPNVAELDDEGTQVYNTIAVRDAYSVDEVDGTRIRAGDARLYVSPALATDPAPGDLITFDGTKFVVVTSRPIKPATVVVCHDVQVRSA